MQFWMVESFNILVHNKLINPILLLIYLTFRKKNCIRLSFNKCSWVDELLWFNSLISYRILRALVNETMWRRIGLPSRSTYDHSQFFRVRLIFGATRLVPHINKHELTLPYQRKISQLKETHTFWYIRIVIMI